MCYTQPVITERTPDHHFNLNTYHTNNDVTNPNPNPNPNPCDTNPNPCVTNPNPNLVHINTEHRYKLRFKPSVEAPVYLTTVMTKLNLKKLETMRNKTWKMKMKMKMRTKKINQLWELETMKRRCLN